MGFCSSLFGCGAFSLDVNKCCGCVSFKDSKRGLVLMALLQLFVSIWSIVFGILASVVEQINLNTAEGEEAQTVLSAVTSGLRTADTASGFNTRTKFGFPYFDFSIGFLAFVFTICARFVRSNKQQQWFAIFATTLYMLLGVAEYVGFVLALAYAAGCDLGDNKCVTVGVITSFFYLFLIPVHFHFGFVMNAFREFLGGRPMKEILFGKGGAARPATTIGKSTEMAMQGTPAPQRPMLAVPANNFNNSPRSHVGSLAGQSSMHQPAQSNAGLMSQRGAGYGLNFTPSQSHRTADGSVATGNTNSDFNSQQQQQHQFNNQQFNNNIQHHI